jgi:glutathione S-transferase
VLGENYSVCDPYLFTVMQWMEGDGVHGANYPKIADHRQRMSERPQVRQALDIEFPQRAA